MWFWQILTKFFFELGIISRNFSQINFQTQFLFFIHSNSHEITNIYARVIALIGYYEISLMTTKFKCNNYKA